MNNPEYIFLAVIVMAVIFFAVRGVILWYYRINDGIRLLEEIRDELKKQNGQTPSIESKQENTVFPKPEEIGTPAKIGIVIMIIAVAAVVIWSFVKMPN